MVGGEFGGSREALRRFWPAAAGSSAGRDRVSAIRCSRIREASPIMGRKYTVGFENVFVAREDARPPGEGPVAPVHYVDAHGQPPD